MQSIPYQSEAVAEYFEALPEAIRIRSSDLRILIFKTGKRVEPIGGVTETLKWGQASYSTIAGSPIRLGVSKSRQDCCALFFHCQTKLVGTFREIFPRTLYFEGNRAIVLPKERPIPRTEITRCIELAFNYHRVKQLPKLGVE